VCVTVRVGVDCVGVVCVAGVDVVANGIYDVDTDSVVVAVIYVVVYIEVSI